jgi:protein tyrosine phosphatase (PTP) superfamily phosphohydrolase (DUF442 family)
VHLKNSARLSTAVLALTLSLGPAGAQYAFAGPQASSVAVPAIRIDNFGRIDGTYYRGAQPQGRDYSDLAALGVKTVINLTSDDASADEQGLVEHAGMKYVQIPMTTRQAPTAQQLSEFLKLVNDPASQPVYVHCVGGRHRTGVMTAAYRITRSFLVSSASFNKATWAAEASGLLVRFSFPAVAACSELSHLTIISLSLKFWIAQS